MTREWLDIKRHWLLITVLVLAAAVLTIARYEAGLVLLATWGIVWLLLKLAPGLRAPAARLRRRVYLVAASALVAALAVVVWALGRPPQGAMAQEPITIYAAWIEPLDGAVTDFQVREYICRLPRDECAEPSPDDAEGRIVGATDHGFALRAVRLLDSPVDRLPNHLRVRDATIELRRMPKGSFYHAIQAIGEPEITDEYDPDRVGIRWTLDEVRTDDLAFSYVPPAWVPWRAAIEPVLGVSSLNNLVAVLIASLTTLAVGHLPSLLIMPVVTALFDWVKSCILLKSRKPRRATVPR